MKTGFRVLSAVLCGSILSAFAGIIAQAEPIAPMTFLDGGYAEHCYLAARGVDDPVGVKIIGSRAPIPSVELCNLAIREGRDKTSLAASYTNRGVVRFAKSDIDAALSDFEEAARLDDSLAQAHINRGYIFNLRQQWAEAIAAFDRGISLGVESVSGPAAAPSESTATGGIPEIARAHLSRGIAHENLGHQREAYFDYLEASELAPEWTAPGLELERFTVSRN